MYMYKVAQRQSRIMSSMFRSPEDVSSSDSEPLPQFDPSDTTGWEPGHPKKVPTDASTDTVENSPPHEYETSHYEQIETSGRLDQGDIPDLNAEGQAAMMTAALLEFYCQSRAADILNGQPESHGQYTRDSPEAKFLGRHMYAYKSQFLSHHGVIAGGVDGEDWESTRQFYRDNLDVLGVAALGDADLNSRSPHPPSRGVIGQAAGTIDVGQLQTRLEGLDLENIKNFTPQRTSRPNLQRRITDKAHAEAPNEQMPPNIADLVRHIRTPFPHLPINLPALYAPTMNFPGSRYRIEFEEEAMIGRGSYGAVYRVRHHVDGQVYAVKKIPLGEKRLRQVQECGLLALDNILKEVRTLARLEHPNVVRYYGAWAEYPSGPILKSSSTGFPVHHREMDDNQQPLLSPVSSSQQNDDLNFSIVFEDSSHGIVFENSSKDCESAIEETGPSSDSPSSRHNKRKCFQKSSCKTDIGDDEVQSLPRHFDFPTPGQTTTESETNDDIFTDGMGHTGSRCHVSQKVGLVKPNPVLMLHIQMSLHPVSLAKYLIAKPVTLDQKAPHHCFHLVPSLKIILGVLAGVEYLHTTGIVHRDLKPANIFLSPAGVQDNPVCPTCEKAGIERTWYTTPRIGDFGLVAEISRFGDENEVLFDSVYNSTGTPIRPVGTEFYRPPIVISPCSSSRHRIHHEIDDNGDGHGGNEVRNRKIQKILNIDESLDVFALGVILFELLYKFETRMERQMALCDLTCSPNKRMKHYQHDYHHQRRPSGLVPTLPSDFAAKVDCSGIFKGENEKDAADILRKLTECIQGMLDPDPRCRWPCKDVQRCLNDIVSRVENPSWNNGVGLN
ncbi:eukaryotic translation initiation factor 2-alpha kinase [Histoplasma capsulatum var. duboisii H88]|uniref:Eukaryotic translation initiation factor 2-alpha kinase n=2 Tax=Ajellomyces capsulatus (strain H88) TaxID=544711 RepID=A0A8A1LD96_AJEC8|nr:eukaryotic translation initiation factor 2-alpha kinase [Histoplasma capsulatum var. duboisii H88]